MSSVQDSLDTLLISVNSNTKAVLKKCFHDNSLSGDMDSQLMLNFVRIIGDADDLLQYTPMLPVCDSVEFYQNNKNAIKAAVEDEASNYGTTAVQLLADQDYGILASEASDVFYDDVDLDHHTDVIEAMVIEAWKRFYNLVQKAKNELEESDQA